MMRRTFLRGVCAAVLTPLNEHLEPDSAKAIPYYRALLDGGCHALNVLGTTGEALSLSVRQRLVFMEEIAASGLPLSRIMVGTSAAALADAIELTRSALALGFAGALIMPPPVHPEVDESGVVQFYSAIADALDVPGPYIYLYNFPKLSRVAFSLSLVERLVTELPSVIAGLKDSSNDLTFEQALAKMLPDLAIFPSSECHLLATKALDLAGCVSGTVCLWPELARTLWDAPRDADADARQQELCALRARVTEHGLIRSVRFLTGLAQQDASWERTLSLLHPLTRGPRAALGERGRGLLRGLFLC
jgi:4-hydroxy-tetrahydrodipicolinate synthase